MKESFFSISSKDMAHKYLNHSITNIREISKVMLSRVWVQFSIKMEIVMKDSGKVENLTARVHIRVKQWNIKEDGKKTNCMVMEQPSGEMEESTKVAT
jgi:hypothetical protein